MDDATEIRALLLREPFTVDLRAARAHFSGRRVMITGAAGSVGGALARELAGLGVDRLCLLDHHASGLYELDGEIGQAAPMVSRSEILCDVRDRRAVEAAVARERPDVILHAAAIKHVDLCERHVCEGVLTNLIGARVVAEAAAGAGALVVLISTDKAARPSGMMGAAKRLAERVVAGLDADGHGRACAVRFGNVFASSGSVVQIFRRQIAAGGPITVTHPRMERYFMTAREAVRLVLTAAALRDERRADGAATFILEMGQPVRIVDLAERMAAQARARGADVTISFTAPRAGDMLTESLVDVDEAVAPAGAAGVFAISPALQRAAIRPAALDAIEAAARAGEELRVREAVEALLLDQTGRSPAGLARVVA